MSAKSSGRRLKHRANYFKIAVAEVYLPSSIFYYMADKPEVVLKATEEVVKDIQHFTDTEVAKELLDLFEFRLFEQNGLLSEKELFASYEHESDFIYWELSAYPELKGKLDCDYEEMEKELNFLYYACSVGYYQDVENRLLKYVDLLEGLYSSEEAILAEIKKKSATGHAISYKGGRLKISEYSIEPPVSFYSRFEMYNKIDYASFMYYKNSEFVKNISRFITDKSYKHRLKTVTSEARDSLKFSQSDIDRLPSQDNVFDDQAEEKLRKLFVSEEKFNAFKVFCKSFSKTLIGAGARDEITQEVDNRYEWLGIPVDGKTVKIASLGYFIYVLLIKGYLKRTNDNKDIARIFIPFFFERKTSVKSLAQVIGPDERFTRYFSHVV